MRHWNGFTLIELMVAVVVVAILATIAYPSYMSHMRETRRATAEAALVELAQFMQRVYSDHNTYQPDGANPALPFTEAPLDSNPKYYDLAVQAATADTFTLRATPKNGQAGTGFLEITHTGQVRWDRDDDGNIAPDELSWKR